MNKKIFKSNKNNAVKTLPRLFVYGSIKKEIAAGVVGVGAMPRRVVPVKKLQKLKARFLPEY